MHYALLFLLFVALAGCSDEGSSSSVISSKEVEKQPGMVKVNSSGKSVYLGTDKSSARSAERPRMKVNFDYDFLISTHEVTCGEFNELMHKTLLLDCDEYSLPAVNVNYFDAVLFANARSKSEKRDTAYTYVSANFDGSGHCVGLEGLGFDASAKAYRLPSEAEWNLVAETVWNTKKEWTVENSDFRSHLVCSASKGDGSICDMVGNVKEWVNDWLGSLRDTSLYNYMGAPEGNHFGERVIKGGSFREERSSAAIYRRGDTYVVSSTTRNEYVGFRLAFGAIPDPVWLFDEGAATTSPVKPLLNSSSMRSITGTYQTKLVFRNDVTGNLTFVDYSQTPISVHEYHDSLDVYHPDISPDGKWVAFCTGMEGVQSPSKVYVRRLDEFDSNAIELDVKSAAIPRFRVTPDRDTVIVYVTSAENNKDLASFKKQSTWQVPFRKGKFGTPQKLFDGAFHGGVDLEKNFAVTGARLLRTRSDSGDSLWYNGEQACNASLATDGTDRTLFLDFGGKTGIGFVGESYGVHERLLLVDSLGKLIQSVAAPEGYSFDHSEWTNVNQKVVVSLTNNDGSHSKIGLVDLEDSSVVDLVMGEELWHPALWAKRWSSKNTQLDRDSAGVYLLDDDSWGSVLMRYKMELLWKYRNRADVVVLGSSRPLYGISPEVLGRHFFTLNLAQTPNSIYVTRDFLDKYLFTHLTNLKYIVLSLDIDFWWKIDGPESDNFFARDFPRYPGYVYDENHDFWKDGVPNGLLEATESALGVEKSIYYTADLGRFMGPLCSSWGETPEVVFDSTYIDDNVDLLENSFDALEHILDEASHRNIGVVGVIFPQSPDYRNTGAFGHSGLRRSVAKKLTERIQNLEKSYSNFVLMDENKMGDHDYADSMAVDNDHLCLSGARQLSERLDSLLLKLDKGRDE
ncbi:MAG: TIGR02171 family protein [Fibrobacter sp.]|nr:TIGR02171 family protein [Fibrobacter sp.]